VPDAGAIEVDMLALDEALAELSMLQSRAKL